MKLRFAMVCASNQNRSMEAHKLLREQGLQVESFGVGGHVKLPGPSASQPNIFEFGTPYRDIYKQLKQADAELYSRNGILEMLRRNMDIKTAPERWQDNREEFDIVVTFEERILQQLMNDMNSRDQVSMQPCLVINMDVNDTHHEAGRAAPHTLLLCQMLEEAEDWADSIDDIVQKFQKETGRHPLYDICFY